LVLRCDLYLQ